MFLPTFLLAFCPLSTAVVGTALSPGERASQGATIVLVVGAGGTDEYAEQFASWADRWEAAAAKGHSKLLRIGPRNAQDQASDQEAPDREALLSALSRETEGVAPLYVVFLGHGTFAGDSARWNLRGPDLTALDLATALEQHQRPTAVIACSASSAPFINRLSRPGRVVITATRSGDQYSFSRFGDAFSNSLSGLEADLDGDQQVSLLESFLFASARTAEFYSSEGRLASEHALLDDNGDALGTLSSWFGGVRSIKQAEGDRVADGLLAHQFHVVPSPAELNMPEETRQRRAELELALDALRRQREGLTEEDYDARLEVILLKLARIYDALEASDR